MNEDRGDWRQQMETERRQWEEDQAAQAEYAEWIAEIERKAAIAYRTKFTHPRKDESNGTLRNR